MTHATPKISRAPASILIVDDTPANLQVLAGMLKERHYKVRPVPSGKLALQAARREAPDLILLDINMPEMNGYQVCEQLKADETLKDVPVIFISALTEPIDKVKAFSTGGVDYLTKPFHIEELHARVETHLKLRRQQRDLEEYSHDLEAAQARMRKDLDLARTVQRSLLPVTVPDVPGYEFFAHYEPALEVGGDYYDFIRLPHGRLAVVLGDVVGKGVAAALVMAKLTADVRFCMLSEPDPAAAFTRLNGLVHEANIPNIFVTAVAAVLDPHRHTVTLVNAGHPLPLLYRRTSATVAEPVGSDRSGFPLGVIADHNYSASEISLEPDDVLLAFTDGVTEAMDGKQRQLQVEGVRAAVHGGNFSPKTLGQHVVDTIKGFTSNGPQTDDISVISFGRHGSVH